MLQYFVLQIAEKLRRYLYIILFGLLIVLLGFLSFSSLMDYYVNDLKSLNEWSADLGSRFETDFASSFYQKLWFLNMNGGMRNVFGQREMNGVVKLDNGHLIMPGDFAGDAIIQTNAENIIRFKNYLEEKDILFAYAITLTNNSKYEPSELPEGTADFGNENWDKLKDLLKDGGVTVIDFREELYKDGISQYDMMYKTDHHWTTEMGFYAYQKFTDFLEAGLSCEVDPAVKTLDNYKITTYPDWHLGSAGQRTGRFFAGVDDFDLIVPQFETFLTDMDKKHQGSYEELLIDTEALKHRDLNSRLTYDSVLSDSQGNFINHLSRNDKKILVISDSFGKAVCPFLDISYGQVRSVDGPVGGELIDSFQPDAVLVFYELDNSIHPYYYEYDM